MEGGQLKINSLTAEDSGTYICSARSEFVHVETEVQLIVKTGKHCAHALSPSKYCVHLYLSVSSFFNLFGFFLLLKKFTIFLFDI